MTDGARLLSIVARDAPMADPKYQLKILNDLAGADTFSNQLTREGLWPLKPTGIDVFQINLGKLCNQTCRHCHVDAGPDRREVMTQETMQQCLDALAQTDIPTVDITGGAPEMVPHFRWLVSEIKKLGRHIIDRCNLTIIETNKHRDLPDFFAEHEVEVVCSLPHYRPFGTDRQRGDGVFEKSVAALKRLNDVGYGDGKSGLKLVLVTNPVGAFLPGGQQSLESEWKREMQRLHGIAFDSLFTITNIPISRYLEWLQESDNLEGYMQKLVENFNGLAAANVMCRNTISVGWEGDLYDCDFNQMLDMKVDGTTPQHIKDFDVQRLVNREIQTAPHCFGCTAGAGSSCGGATA